MQDACRCPASYPLSAYKNLVGTSGRQRAEVGSNPEVLTKTIIGRNKDE